MKEEYFRISKKERDALWIECAKLLALIATRGVPRGDLVVHVAAERGPDIKVEHARVRRCDDALPSAHPLEVRDAAKLFAEQEAAAPAPL